MQNCVVLGPLGKRVGHDFASRLCASCEAITGSSKCLQCVLLGPRGPPLSSVHCWCRRLTALRSRDQSWCDRQLRKTWTVRSRSPRSRRRPHQTGQQLPRSAIPCPAPDTSRTSARSSDPRITTQFGLGAPSRRTRTTSTRSARWCRQYYDVDRVEVARPAASTSYGRAATRRREHHHHQPN